MTYFLILTSFFRFIYDAVLVNEMLQNKFYLLHKQQIYQYLRSNGHITVMCLVRSFWPEYFFKLFKYQTSLSHWSILPLSREPIYKNKITFHLHLLTVLQQGLRLIIVQLTPEPNTGLLLNPRVQIHRD